MRRRKSAVFLSVALLAAFGGLVAWRVLPVHAAQQGSLVGYWKFDEASSGAAADVSGNANTLAPTNGPAPDTNVPTAMGTAFADSHSVNFDGSQYFSVADNSTLDSNAVSISTWVKFDAVDGQFHTIAGKWQVGAKQQWLLQLNNDNKIGFWTGTGTVGGTDNLESAATVTSGAWYHIVATYTNGSKKLYVNGSLSNSNNGAGVVVGTGTAPFTVGSKQDSGGLFFEHLDGNIDDLRVYSRVLGATEASDLSAGKHTTATWTGTLSNDYNNAANWDIGAAPDAYTNIVVNGGGPGSPTLSSAVGVASLRIATVADELNLSGHNLTFNDGGTFSNNGILALQGGETLANFTNDVDSGYVIYGGAGTYVNLAAGSEYYIVNFFGAGSWTASQPITVNNSLIMQSGTMNFGGSGTSHVANLSISTGTMNAGASTIDITGSTFNTAGGTFNAGTGTVNFSDSASISGNNTFYNLTETAPGVSQLSFAAGSTQTITHNLALTGADADTPLILGSSSPGTQWKLNSTGTNTLSNLWVRDSNNLGAILKPTGTNVDNGNNVNWNLHTPNTPSNLGAAAYINGSFGTDTTPIVSYNITDPDNGDTVRYRIQIDNDSDFSSPTVDYTSALEAQGTKSFTVGQAAGSGSYAAGSGGQTLSEGTYYWRVMALDSGGDTSGWTVANSGNIAFGIDTTNPTTPGTPSVSTDSGDNTPTWNWTASTDSGSGLGDPIAYGVEWSQDSNFSGLGGTAGITGNSYTIPDGLNMTDGTWYFHVKAIDAAGNESAWSAPGTVYVNTTVLTGGSSIVNELGTTSAITDLQVTSAESNPNVAVKLFVGNGTIVLTTTTGLTFYNPDGTVRAGQPSNSADLQFGGTMNDVNTALATLHYTRTGASIGTDALSASLVQPGEVFFSGTNGNNHLYEYVAGPVTWSQAKTNAAASSKYGAGGYLATITSSDENSFIQNRLKSDSWIGASDSDTEGVWKWVTGPENGQQFWSGTGSGDIFGSMYAHWNNPKTGGSGVEPNQSGDEDCAEFYYSNNGLWNDLNCTSTLGYIVEYGGLNGVNPIVSSKDVSITTADTTAPSKPGKPTAATPTTDTTPAVSWSAASDSGTGLKNPAYTLEWSSSATFAFVTGSATTNGTSLSPSSLAEGTWYFRVLATDNSNNTVASDISNPIVIDLTAPDVPTLISPVIFGYTNNPSSTFTWSASSGSPSGYVIQLSKDDTFTSGVTTGNVSTTEYTPGSPLSDGKWYWRVSSKDDLDNQSTWSAIWNVTIDTQVPSTPGKPGLDRLPTNNAYSAPYWTESTDSGPAGIEKYNIQWAVDPTFSFHFDSSVSVPGVPPGVPTPNGTFYGRVQAVDRAGNVSDWSDVGMAVVDTAAPDTPAVSVAGKNYTATQHVSLSADDNGPAGLDAIYYTIDGSTPTDSSTKYTEAITVSGNTTIKAIAYDKAGNISSVMIQTYTIGSAAPTQTPSAQRFTGRSADQEQIEDNSETSPAPKSDNRQEPTNQSDKHTTQPESNTNKPSDTNATSSGPFLGLGWWWLPVLGVPTGFWWLIALLRRRKKRD